jgi:hypothetical protein
MPHRHRHHAAHLLTRIAEFGLRLGEVLQKGETRMLTSSEVAAIKTGFDALVVEIDKAVASPVAPGAVDLAPLATMAADMATAAAKLAARFAPAPVV